MQKPPIGMRFSAGQPTMHLAYRALIGRIDCYSKPMLGDQWIHTKLFARYRAAPGPRRAPQACEPEKYQCGQNRPFYALRNDIERFFNRLRLTPRRHQIHKLTKAFGAFVLPGVLRIWIRFWSTRPRPIDPLVSVGDGTLFEHRGCWRRPLRF